VVLIPEKTSIARWSWNHFHFDRKLHRCHARFRLAVLTQNIKQLNTFLYNIRVDNHAVNLAFITAIL